MVLPSPHVADVAGIAQLWPATWDGHYRVVQSDREQDCLAGLPLLRERGLDLLLDPLAGNRVLREQGQELVVDADCLIDASADRLADLQVLTGVPAADAFVLEILVVAAQ